MAVLRGPAPAGGEVGNVPTSEPIKSGPAPAASRSRRPTLAAIAAEAGVSLPTVYKVVNGRPDVAPGTRALVERLLGEAKYPT